MAKEFILYNTMTKRKEVFKPIGKIGKKLCLHLTYSEVLHQLKDKALKRAALTEEDVLRAIEERTSARENRDFARSDQIRNELAVKGIALMDVGKKTVWKPCVSIQLLVNDSQASTSVSVDNAQSVTTPAEEI